MIAGVLLGMVLAVLPAHAARAERPALDRYVLTSDGPHYRYRYDGHRLVIRGARPDREPNRREVVVDSRAQSGREQTSCATWARESTWRVQQGLAVRVVDRAGRVRAVTMGKNIVWGVQTIINVLTWDTSRRGTPWRAVAQEDMAGVLLKPNGRLMPLPWRACLRVVGRQVTFKIWPQGRVPQPSWSDPDYTRSSRLPRSFGTGGRPGWYIGHVPSGGRAVYRGLTTR